MRWVLLARVSLWIPELPWCHFGFFKCCCCFWADGPTAMSSYLQNSGAWHQVQGGQRLCATWGRCQGLAEDTAAWLAGLQEVGNGEGHRRRIAVGPQPPCRPRQWKLSKAKGPWGRRTLLKCQIFTDTYCDSQTCSSFWDQIIDLGIKRDYCIFKKITKARYNRSSNKGQTRMTTTKFLSGINFEIKPGYWQRFVCSLKS